MHLNNNLSNSENPDETAHKEPSHLDLHCLHMCVRIYLMSEFTRLYPIHATKRINAIEQNIALMQNVAE